MAAPKGKIPPNGFKPGNSGNPSGRPKIPKEVKELAKAHTQSAVKVLADMLTDEDAPHSVKVTAATALLDRGWGKATQYIEAKISPLDELDHDEQCAVLETLAAITQSKGDTEEGTGATRH